MILRIVSTILAFVFSIGVNLDAQSAPYQLSGQAKISLITCGPWQGELYSAFGHSAIRVEDPQLGIDWSFNYGTFDFNQSNFYLNFARGRNFYMLSVQEYPLFRDSYIRYNRYIHEQVLNLNTTQQQQLFDFLWKNALPENRSYRYDYFYDNCSTKPRDVFKLVFGNQIQFNPFPIEKSISIRQLTDLYLVHQPWGDLGIDLCLGLPMDKEADSNVHMFLPDFLEKGFDFATIQSEKGQVPLVQEKIIVYQSTPEASGFSLTHPLITFGLLLIIAIGISYYDLGRHELSRWLDQILFSITGLLGLLLLLLWFATDHRAAAWNHNLLWAMPLNLFLPWIRTLTSRRRYFLIMSVLTVVLLMTWPYLPQELNLMFLPVVLALLFRYYVNFRLLSSVKIES